MRSKLIRAAAAFAISAMTTQAFATSCNDFVIDLQMPGWRIVGAFVGSDDCEHGEITNVTPNGATLAAA